MWYKVRSGPARHLAGTHAPRGPERAPAGRASCLTRVGLEPGNLVWQWYLCPIRIAPSPGRSAPYWLVPVVGARSGPSDSMM